MFIVFTQLTSIVLFADNRNSETLPFPDSIYSRWDPSTYLNSYLKLWGMSSWGWPCYITSFLVFSELLHNPDQTNLESSPVLFWVLSTKIPVRTDIISNMQLYFTTFENSLLEKDTQNQRYSEIERNSQWYETTLEAILPLDFSVKLSQWFFI